jgi:hypothetical protein
VCGHRIVLQRGFKVAVGERRCVLGYGTSTNGTRAPSIAWCTWCTVSHILVWLALVEARLAKQDFTHACKHGVPWRGSWYDG